MPRLRRIVLAVMLALTTAFSAMAIAPAHAHAKTEQATEASTEGLEFTSVKELEGKCIGTGVGGIFDQLIVELNPKIKDFLYYATWSDLVAALKSNRIDAIAIDDPIARLLVSRNEGIGIMPEVVAQDDYGMVLPKGSPYTERLNTIIEGFRADGTLDKLAEKWCGSDEAAKTMIEQDWDTSAGTLKLGTEGSSEPMTYMRDGEIVGYDVELALMCARELHMGLDIEDMRFDALLANVQSGKLDLAASCISITEERQKTMDFTVPTYHGALEFVVRDNSSNNGGSALGGFWASFERTFITESRWQLILSGLGVTVAITLLSGALGTLLGFVTVLLRRRGNHVASALVSGFEGLMGRLPIVVVLMVFYYVIFGAIDMPGLVVAVMAFTLAFGATAGSIMWNAVQAVDIGQTEASLALGFNDRKTFFGVVLPQAARQFLPLLSGQFVSLAKDTSVVGYIAVQDLTRASDLIRSRTMEAFFPLIATAIIYFGLCCLLAAGMRLVIWRFDLNRRPRTIKGVEM